MLLARKYPIGAERMTGDGVHFRVWAPRSKTVAVEFVNSAGRIESTLPLQADGGGYFSGAAPNAAAGARYKFKLEHGSFPDPAARLQPEGPHGPSEIVDASFPWTDEDWRGRPAHELVVYELHLGTFTPEG